MHRRLFGTLPDGSSVDLITLTEPTGTSVDISSYGGAVVSWYVPSEDGGVIDVVLGFSRLEDYLTHTGYFGAVVGRYANRIGHAQFSLDGQTHHLTANEPPNHLHGGQQGFDKAVWTVASADTPAGEAVVLTHMSRDGDEGYPGTVYARVLYLLTASGELVLDSAAVASAPTVINLTNHAYFNLNGEGNGDIRDHVLTIHASAYTPVTPLMIPDGRILPVAGTPFDFRVPHRIGSRIDAFHEQLQRAGGYDHNWVLDDFTGRLREVAVLSDRSARRTLHVATTEPGLQCYTGNRLDGSWVGKSGRAYERHAGVCLETQHFPDTPNRPAFPSAILRPGEQYRSTTVFRLVAGDSRHSRSN